MSEERTCKVYSGVEISIDEPEATGMVIRPFIIELTPSGEGYMATSRISNAFEFGSTLFQAARNYLEFLVDEILWLQKNVEHLSPSIREDLRLLQRYLRIM